MGAGYQETNHTFNGLELLNAYLLNLQGEKNRRDFINHQWLMEAGFHSGSVVKISPAMLQTQLQSLGREDPLEDGMATHSSILA